MSYPFRQARLYRPHTSRKIDLIVVHTMEAPEKPNTAEGCAVYFQSAAAGGSAHYCVDADSIVQCVQEKDEAAGAPGANHDGIHIEFAGYAKQSAEDWSDVYSTAMLDRGAKLTAQICKRRDIPVRWLLPHELRAGERGITSHANVSEAFKRSTHWDPGPSFPVGRFLRLIRENLS